MPQFSVAPLFPIPYTTTTTTNVRSSIDSLASDGMIMPVYK
jgi:hypothetical protein